MENVFHACHCLQPKLYIMENVFFFFVNDLLILISMFLDQLSLSEIKELYGTRHIGRDQARQLVGLMDVFCFSEVLLNRSKLPLTFTLLSSIHVVVFHFWIRKVLSMPY